MIGNFPERYPDELFYSLCARYSDIRRYQLIGAIFRDLFRSEKPIVSTLLARKLGVFINQLPPGHGLTVDTIIDNHTLLPFFAPFLPSERIKRLREGMIDGSYTTPLDAGIYNPRIKLPDTLYFCPLCAAEERKQFGECYWHRLHQIPGVEVCPVHHTWLEPSPVPVNFSTDPRYISAEQAVPSVEARFLDPANFSHRVLLDIANEFSWLGEQLGLVLDMEAMQRRYVAVLVERGLASYQGGISHSKLLEAFKQYYPEILLRLLQCDIEESIDTHWLTRLLRATASANHPLYHLLLINFLGYRLADFICLPTEYKPFGSGPSWPCLNLVCKPHLKLTADLIAVKYISLGAKPTGTFTCMECGFTYYRTGPDHSEEDQFRRNKNVKIYGRVWEETLIKLWSDESLSLQQIADQLGVSIATLKRQAARLGLEISGSGQRLRQEFLTMASISKNTADEGVTKLESYQTEWLAALEQDADLPVREFHAKHKRVYTWLHRNDREWLLKHLPPRKKNRKAIPPRFDWPNRDVEWAKQVRSAGLFLRNQTDPFRQVTKFAIGQILGITNVLYRQLDKLPLTVAALTEVLETTEQYAIRRIWQVARMCCREEVLPTPTQLLDRAGAGKHSKQPVIVDTITTALKILSQANPDCRAIKNHLPTDIDEVVELPFIDRRSRDTSRLDWTRNNVPPSIAPDANNKIEPSLKNSTTSRSLDRESLGQTPDRRRFDSAYKLRILDELDACTELGQKTAIIERERLYTSHITQWRRARAEGRLIESTSDLPSEESI